jgi:phospho-N-acetylmuramoyl-pentapeptide-transferase|nr:phospho-N-acetylmuramoyl-pentapeptide-transferase [uncultured Porphyromonas sp.]
MIYHLVDFLSDQGIVFPFSRLFTYVSFRVGMAIILSLLISTIWGGRLIKYLRRRQIGELVRDLGLEGEQTKKGTPTMGGIIIILAILIPTLLFARLDNIYIILMIVTTILMGLLGFADDYIKVFKKDKNGLKEHYKIFGQVVLGLIVGVTLYLSPSVVIKRNSEIVREGNTREIRFETTDTKSFQTSVPFVKDNNLDYSEILPIDDPGVKKILGVTIFIMMTVVVVMLLSNGVNLTDGVDGLASGSSAIVGVVLGILAYVSSHHDMAGYLNTMFIPGAEELVIFAATLVGATVGFLWYNSYPAQVFMGDTGSLALGGIIGVFAILIRKELLLPILCGVFIAEFTSSFIQRFYYKYTRHRTGTGVRVFKMAPLHHHFQLPGGAAANSLLKRPVDKVPEAKLTMRFWLIGIILAVLTIVTLKIR